jgi:hypothetical protein
LRHDLDRDIQGKGIGVHRANSFAEQPHERVPAQSRGQFAEIGVGEIMVLGAGSD